MKTLALIALMTLSSIPAFALRGNDGPSGSPVKDKKPTVLAEESVSCGFCRPAGVHGVRILSNGEVIRFSVERGQPESSEKIGELTPRVVANLQKKANDLPNEALIDKDAGQPYCMDAPMTTFAVTKADGTRLEIARVFNCHDETLQYEQGKDIRSLLEGFMNLSY